MTDTKSLGLWKKLQGFLAERFFYLLDDRYYLKDRNSPKRKFIEAHSHVTAMLRVPSFLNSNTKVVDLFTSRLKRE